MCPPCYNDYKEVLEGRTEFLPSLKDYTEVLEGRTECLPPEVLQGKSVCPPCYNDYKEVLNGTTEFLSSLKDYTEVLEGRTECLPTEVLQDKSVCLPCYSNYMKVLEGRTESMPTSSATPGASPAAQGAPLRCREPPCNAWTPLLRLDSPAATERPYGTRSSSTTPGASPAGPESSPASQGAPSQRRKPPLLRKEFPRDAGSLAGAAGQERVPALQQRLHGGSGRQDRVPTQPQGLHQLH